MGRSIAHICGRGRGATSAQIVTLHCDDDCRSTVSADNREAYQDLLARGWRVTPSAGDAIRVTCPDHSGATPTVDVQETLL